MSSSSQALAPRHAITTIEGIDDELLAMIRQELNKQEQQMFLNSCVMYIKYDQRKDFVIDFDNICASLQINKADLKRTLTGAQDLKKDIDYKVGIFSTSAEKSRGRPSERILLTPYAFKMLCLASDSAKVKVIHKYFVSMEEVVLKYTTQKLVKLQELAKIQHDREQALIQEKDAALAEAAAKEAELQRLRDKDYDEIAKVDKVYIWKDHSELHTDNHKFGKALDEKRRARQFKTSSVRDGTMVYVRPTHNAKIIEDIIEVVLRVVSE